MNATATPTPASTLSDLSRRPTLTGPQVTLRAPKPADVDGRFVLGNSPEIQRLFGGDPAQTRPLTRAAAENWVQTQIDNGAWIIEHEGALIGEVRLHSINHADRNARLAIGILDEARLGQGLGTQAMRLVAAYAFDTLHLHRLSLRVLDFNTRAIAAYRKLGFTEEGRERQSALIGQDWHDDVIMGLLAQEFLR